MDNDGSFMSNMHLATLFDCINCDYMQAKDIDEDVKKLYENMPTATA